MGSSAGAGLVKGPTASVSSPVQVLLKLFSYCVKVKVNRQQLVKLEMNTLNVMLGTLNLVRLPMQWRAGRGGGPGAFPGLRGRECRQALARSVQPCCQPSSCLALHRAKGSGWQAVGETSCR